MQLHIVALLLAPVFLANASADSLRSETFTVVSHGLAESRVINVYAPPGYASGVAALPVVYMLDGGMSEDFPHVAATLDSLIRRARIRRIPPITRP